MEKISVWRLMAETVNSPISIADVQKFNGIDEAKVANGQLPTIALFKPMAGEGPCAAIQR